MTDDVGENVAIKQSKGGNGGNIEGNNDERQS